MPSDPHTPIATLREQYQAQGYLWLRGLLNCDAALLFPQRYPFASISVHVGICSTLRDTEGNVRTDLGFWKEVTSLQIAE